MKRWLIAASTFALVAAACTAGGETKAPATIDPSASNEPVTLTYWGAWTGRENREFAKIFDRFEEQYPWITVKNVGGIDDQKLISAINAGNPPDASQSFSPDNTGKFCSSGAFISLNELIQQENLDLDVFPPGALANTTYEGNTCGLPFTLDAYGLYYNKDLLAGAGYDAPPATITELTEMAKKLTVFDPDGSIRVAGFVPWFGYYEHQPINLGKAFGGEWYDEQGRSALATDPAWSEMLQWQKELVDFYGADELAKFVSGQGSEFSPSNDFQTGRVAMIMDGEWRVAFIDDGAPQLNYGTAPFPVADDRPELYGSGEIAGDIIGIPRGSEHPAEAWLLLKFMATDTQTLVYMGNVIRNVPTTFEALQSPDLDAPPEFQTFLDIATNPQSSFKQLTLLGDGDQTIFMQWLERWQSGRIPDLQAGLEQLSGQIDDQVAQASV